MGRKLNKVMLFIDQKPPRFDQDAGSRQMLSYLRLFSKNGYKIYFWSHDVDPDPFYRRRLESLGVTVLGAFPYLLNFRRWIGAYGGDLDIAFLSRPHIAAQYIDAIKERSSCKVVYYGHDLHVERMNLQNRYEPGGWTVEEIERVNGWEAASWEKSDLILYPSLEEVENVRAARPDREVAVLPLSCVPEEEIARAVTDAPFRERSGLLFVGGFAHKPNKDGVLWFLDHVYPEILKECPEMEVLIAGGDPPAEVRSHQSSSVRVLGRISDEELRDCHAKVRLTIAPLRVGAGVKGKVVESLKMGVPVATTSIGIQGLEGASGAIAVGDTPSDLARAVLDLYTDEEKWRAFRAEGIRYYREHFASEAVARQILPLLGMQPYIH